MSVGSMSVLSIYSAQFQHHVRRLLRRARRRQRRRSQRKRSRRRRHRVHTTRGDPTEKPRSRRRTRRGRCTCGPGSREEDEEPLAAPSQEQERLLVPSTTSLSDLPGVVRRVDYLFFAGVAWSLARPRAPLTAPRGACFFSSPPPTPRRRFRRRVVNPGSSFASVAGGPSVPSATESTASAISTKKGACFFLPLSYLARRRRCVAV